MLYERRIGEPSFLSVFERSDRLIVGGDSFFYKTRECEKVGPFESRIDAEHDLRTFVVLSEINNEF